MQELVKRLERLFLKLDHTALMVEQALADALYAVESGKEEDANIVFQSDDVIDAREVETERECIRLLALYQPAAIDLRRICFVVKVNNDLERMADYCAKIAKEALAIKRENISISSFPTFFKLVEQTGTTLRQTFRLFTLRPEEGNREIFSTSAQTVEAALAIIDADDVIDAAAYEFLEQIFAANDLLSGKLKAVYHLASLGRCLERIGDLCANIAEDAVFMLTGEIIRHGGINSNDAR